MEEKSSWKTYKNQNEQFLTRQKIRQTVRFKIFCEKYVKLLLTKQQQSRYISVCWLIVLEKFVKLSDDKVNKTRFFVYSKVSGNISKNNRETLFTFK